MADDNFNDALNGHKKNALNARERQFVRFDMEQTRFRHEAKRKVKTLLFVWIIPITIAAFAVIKWLAATVTLKP